MQLPRMRFYSICTMYAFDYPTLQAIADKAGVAHSIVDSMFVGDPVDRADAEKVIVALSQKTGYPFTLENTKIPLKEA